MMVFYRGETFTAEPGSDSPSVSVLIVTYMVIARTFSGIGSVVLAAAEKSNSAGTGEERVEVAA